MVNKNNINLNFTERPHVLVVDDDLRICTLLDRYLTDQGFVVVLAQSAEEALSLFEAFDFDVLVVDVMMPGRSGVEFTQELREGSDIPVLMLTAMGEIDDRVKGFEVGADDYLVKPFEPKELVMRLYALLRRASKKVQRDLSFTMGDMRYDSQAQELWRAGEVLPLTSAETVLIEALAHAGGDVLSREDLARACNLEPDGRSIDVQITRLRKKIEDDTRHPRYLRTIRGKGYVLKTEEVQA